MSAISRAVNMSDSDAHTTPLCPAGTSISGLILRLLGILATNLTLVTKGSTPDDSMLLAWPHSAPTVPLDLHIELLSLSLFFQSMVLRPAF